MKIAVTYENGNVFQHFGHCKEFKIYEIEDKKIVSTHIAPVTGEGHGALAGFLKSMQVDSLICGGLGGGAKQALNELNIAVYPGVSGAADQAVQSLLTGHLHYNPNTQCSHHEHHGHDGCHEDKHNCRGNNSNDHICSSGH